MPIITGKMSLSDSYAFFYYNLAFIKMAFDVMIDLLAECENGHELLVTLDAIVSQD